MSESGWRSAFRRARGLASRARFGWDVARKTRPRAIPGADLAHWEALRRSGLFDADWYRAAYPDVRHHPDPLVHHATVGWAAGRDPNPLFSTSWYLTTYPDVEAAGMAPLEHYWLNGAREGRDPGPRFDTDWYLASNPDVRAAGVNPLAHFLTAGIHEGRRPVPPPAPPTGDAVRSVVLVSGEPDTPGHHFRVECFADAARRSGVRCTVLTVPEAASTRLADVDRADVVVLWRTSWGPEVERTVLRARMAGAALLFDVDDLMVAPEFATFDVIDGIRSQGLTEDDAAAWFAGMARTVDAVDACTATTSELATVLRLLGRPAHVLPNGYDDATFVRSRVARRARAAAPKDGCVRIGYASGSLTHQRDFALVARAVAETLHARPDARLVLFRGTLLLDEFPEFDDLRSQVEWRDLVPLERLPAELARFDVNLAPLEVDNPFCEAKSELKFFDAALVDVPSIVSPTGPFRSVVTDGVNGMLADGADSWGAALSVLLDDPPRRRAMGEAARRSVLWSRGPDRRAQTVRAVLEQVRRRDGGADAFALELARAARPEESPVLAAARVEVVHDSCAPARVTVVVPVHDYAAVVTEALDSVAAQTLEDLDLVVVDDASTDDSVGVVRSWLREHGSRFRRAVLVIHDENAGVAAARNAGFDLADTASVLPLDADNLLEPRCCEALLDALECSGAAFAYPRLAHFGDGSELLDAAAVRGHLPYSPQRLVGGNYIDALALVRTSAWAAVGGYHQGGGWEDYDLWCRLAELGLGGVQVAEDLARYRVHGASMLHALTHQGTRVLEVRATMTSAHPWLTLTPPTPEELGVELDPRPGRSAQNQEPARSARPTVPARGETVTDDVTEGATRLGAGLTDRARSLLSRLRCPVTGEPLEETADGRLRTIVSKREWPVVHGRPDLFPERRRLHVADGAHVGNPLPARARALVAACDGPVLHVSGGGTRVGDERVVELDADLFPGTDVLGDVHHLPFADAEFELVLALNAFEHYRDPARAVTEIRRVLQPGGLVFVQTAFLQPLHEAPVHFFNATRHGVEEWFSSFEAIDLCVPDNLHPGYALAWLAADLEEALAGDANAGSGDGAAVRCFRAAPLGALADLWRDPGRRATDPRWAALASLAGDRRDATAAGFEYLGRRPAELR